MDIYIYMDQRFWSIAKSLEPFSSPFSSLFDVVHLVHGQEQLPRINLSPASWCALVAPIGSGQGDSLMIHQLNAMLLPAQSCSGFQLNIWVPKIGLAYFSWMVYFRENAIVRNGWGLGGPYFRKAPLKELVLTSKTKGPCSGSLNVASRICTLKARRLIPWTQNSGFGHQTRTLQQRRNCLEWFTCPSRTVFQRWQSPRSYVLHHLTSYMWWFP